MAQHARDSVAPLRRSSAGWIPEHDRLAAQRFVCPVLYELCGDGLPRRGRDETGHRREERPDLPVGLLMVLHALQLESEKRMKLTESSHWSCVWLSQEIEDEGVLSTSAPIGARRMEL